MNVLVICGVVYILLGVAVAITLSCLDWQDTEKLSWKGFLGVIFGWLPLGLYAICIQFTRFNGH